MLNRRQLLLTTPSLILPVSAFANSQAAQAYIPLNIELNLYNIHTGERFNDLIVDNDTPITQHLEKVHHLLRDFRQNESTAMDLSLLLALASIKEHTNSLSSKTASQPLQIISGYRSPSTNKMLSNTSTGVAKKSLHMQGRAIDFRVEGIRTQSLFDICKSMKIGGTGKYISSGFIHLDTGRVRSWG